MSGKVTGTITKVVQENTQFNNSNPNPNFKLTKSKIKEMYKDDAGVKARVNKNSAPATSITNDLNTIKNNYFGYSDLTKQWEYSRDLYNFYPIYANLIDSLSNMYLWRYTYVPRQIKEKAIRRLRQSNKSKLLKGYLG